MSAAPEFPSDQRRAPRREDHFVLEDLPARDRMLYGALAYVCFPVSIYYARWDPFVRFHVRQAVGVLLAWVIAAIASGWCWSLEVPQLGIVGYALATLLLCDGVAKALALEFKGVRVLGRLFDKLPLPLKLAEP